MPTLYRARPHTSRLTALAVALTASLALAGVGAPAAQAAPTGEVEAATAEVARVTEQVTGAEAELQRLTVQTEAAADANRAAQTALSAAQATATQTAVELQAAQAATAQAEADVVTLGREAFMGQTSALGSATALLSADSPEDVLQQAATLEHLGDDRTERLAVVEAVQAAETEADAAARAAVVQLDSAAQAAAAAEAAAVAQLATAQQAYDAAVAQKAVLEQQLLAAQTELLELQGIENAAAAAAAAAQAADVQTSTASVGPGSLVTGRVSSCYGGRWGTTHYGIDIAAPIGTPIYAPEGGVVLQAGPATGFGLAVYVQHPDGVVTVYGHVDSFDVAAGQVVAAGDKIAEVGNRGQSTGPHLHIETHVGGLYAQRVDPVPWLAAHGVDLSGRC